MKLLNHARKLILAVFALVLLSASGTFARPQDDQYRFKVQNTTRVSICKILVSEDGRNYVNFRLRSDIEPGTTRELFWDESTNNQSCKQYLKGVYADGRETKATLFDFCKENLVVRF